MIREMSHSETIINAISEKQRLSIMKENEKQNN